MWRRIFVVFAKETVDNSRDRRSLLVALIYPMLGPMLLGLMISAVVGITSIKTDAKVTLAINGAERAPDLVSYLKKNGFTVKPATADPEAAVRNGDYETVIVVSEDYADKFGIERTAKITIVANTSRLPGLVALNRMAVILGDYNRAVWSKRLKAQGVDLELLQPLRIVSLDVAAGTHIADILLLMVPPLIIFNLFMGGVYMAIDTTSGERERGSLESLLINPVSRWGLMLGKYLAALLYTAFAVVVQLLAFKIIFQIVGGDLSFVRVLDATAVVGIFIVTVPLMMVAVGVQFIIATMTRSFKEAQTYLGLLPLVPAIPGMVLVFAPVQAKEWMMAIPTFSQTLLLSRFIQGEAVAVSDALVSMSTSAAAALLLLAFAARLYEKEELIFGA